MDFEQYDDDGFLDYVPTTVDPGYSLLIATTLFCLLSNAILPCLVSFGRRYEKRKIARQESAKKEAPDEIAKEQVQLKDADENRELGDSSKRSEGDQKMHVPESPSKKGSTNKGGGGIDHKGNTWRTLIDQVRLICFWKSCVAVLSMWVNCSQWNKPHLILFFQQIIVPPYPDESHSVVGGSAFVGGRPLVPEVTRPEDNRSAITYLSAASNTTSSFWDTNILDTGFGTRHGVRGMRRQRRVLRDKELRRQDQKAELEADKKEYATLVITDADGVEHTGMTASQLVGIEPKADRSEVASRVSSHAYGRPSELRGRRGKREGSTFSGMSRKRGEDSTISGMSRRRGQSPERSILSGLEDHVISPNDAADADDPGYFILPKPDVEESQEIDLCCGKRAWWKPSVLVEAFNSLVHLAEYDHEMQRIVKLCIPYSITALLGGVIDVANVALVSQFIGTSAVAAYTLVQLILGLTSEFLGGILGTESTLCSHAVGAGNDKLAGQYVQVCTILFSVLMIPNILLWSFFVDDVIILFGFDENVAQMGQQYARILVFHEWLGGLNHAYTGLLNVVGYENFATAMAGIEGVFSVGATAALVLTRDATLQEVGMVHLAVAVVFFLLTVWISVCHGRMGKYLAGMVGTWAFLVSGCICNVLVFATFRFLIVVSRTKGSCIMSLAPRYPLRLDIYWSMASGRS
jgi:MatE